MFHRLSARRCWTDWPLAIRDGLEEASKAGVAHEMLRSHYLSQLLELFAGQGIRCVLLKGEALAMTHYEIAGTRARSDCDLFIHPSDISAAQQAVSMLGFAVVSPVYKTHQFTVMRTREGVAPVRFDVHWRISNNARYARVISFDEAFEEADEISGIATAKALNDIDALSLACMHRLASDRHDRNRLIWIFDIDLLVQRMSSDQLQEFAKRSVTRSIQGASLDGLLTARRTFNTQVPDSVIDVLGSPVPPRSWSRRLHDSNIGLLIDDWRTLADGTSRLALLRELFFPSGAYLLRKYQKESKLWLPVLYFRQVLGGIFKRLFLR